jgi:hypothetical protein
MHDPWLTSDGPRLSAIAADIFEQCEGLRPIASRRPRRDAVERRRRVSDNLVANLAELVLRHPAAQGVAVSAKNDAITRYDRSDFPREVVRQIVASLEALGLVLRDEGSWSGPRTSIRPSGCLSAKIAATVNANEVGRSPGGETIILSAKNERDHRGRYKLLIDYADTDETRRLRHEMSRINGALNAAAITVDGVECGPVHLTRRFQIAAPDAPHSFDQHGRVYGGFWINMHRAHRHRIRINDEELADLDFTAMFTQLAYLHVGLPLPEGDPYVGFPGLDINGDEGGGAEGRRDAVKRGLNAFYFRSGRMERLPSEVKSRLGKGWNATRFAKAVRERHAPIKHLFGTGIGIRFMYTESCLLVRTLLDLAALEVAALPVHDGIMVPVSKQQVALSAMQAASKAVVGVALPVKAKVLSPPHQQ